MTAPYILYFLVKYGSYFVEELRSLVVFILADGVIELDKLILLLLVESLGDFHNNSYVLIAALGTVQLLDALAFQTECCSRLCAFGYLEVYLAVDAEHFYIVAQYSLCKLYGNFRADIVAVTLEE